ncbi:MAG: UDP-2,3-diacylglucosamine diphosphatase [Bacteroides sp.]|nr:UDP-2,3-diacylglucosamine diphosphatase [Bacteroides sp.]MDD2644856.1 UDP-2,3-diacylglucosamine diphosphatase [Bacteroides sp.]MDD4055157.1 UDP-2,3-diacylglucosamine diphosphatase [Bacteroides sp.]MDD4720777.1 UDP-2,3-diacylglucosamine diphosphatase [Bacteroides sp.]NLI63167.1 UDP-2,3-diacylglucosamine diphosphatase [Bacteroidales bacterium]
MKNIYFLSDAHLGSLAIKHRRMHERRLVNFLDSIKHKASAIYLLGDMFDFWYEFKTVVPKGYTRFLGKLSELTDRGVEVHYFIGNHDIWLGNYFEEECGVTIHKKPLTTEIHGKEFYLAHGDGLGDPDPKFKILRKMFHSKFLQQLFSSIHPRWTIPFGMQWAKQSRLKREDGKEPDYMGEDKEFLVLYTKDYLKRHPNINFFIYGHRHIVLDLQLSRTSRMTILGDWITHFTYAVFDGTNFFLEEYIEGETET